MILSHFYLLTACSTGVWLDSPHDRLGGLVGVLVVGWADAWASVLGKRFGKIRWWWGATGSSKVITMSFIFIFNYFFKKNSCCLDKKTKKNKTVGKDEKRERERNG